MSDFDFDGVMDPEALPGDDKKIAGQRRAMQIVAWARRRNLLPDPKLSKCADCDSQAQVYDHRDYAKPLEVVAVCRICNARRGHALASVGEPLVKQVERRAFGAASGPLGPRPITFVYVDFHPKAKRKKRQPYGEVREL